MNVGVRSGLKGKGEVGGGSKGLRGISVGGY